MGDVKITLARVSDEQQIRELLIAAQLPHEDIGKHLQNLVVARRDDEIVGTVCVEVYGQVGLLRSFTVASADQGKGIGRLLYDAIIAYGRMHGVREVYLLTTTAESFFRKLGFTTIERSRLPGQIQMTTEVQSLCRSAAICMTRKIERDIFHVPRELLRLRSIMQGTTMWAVALDQVMFTYFEIESGTRVEKHRHESEQITYVLEGELYFEFTDRMVCVKSGECIAIPSNTTHAAYTNEKRVRAVDAWSPIRFDYLR